MAISLSHLDPLIQSRSLLKHPFYVKWTKGELSLEDLKVYAKEYCHLVKRIPGIVSRVRDRMPKQYGERLYALADENQREEVEHISLWERFAKSLGVSKEDLDAYVPSRKTRDAVKRLEDMADASFGEGVVTMYALELELPKIARTKREGLLTFYGLGSADARCYFDEHEKEEKHLKVWREVPVNGDRGRAAAKACLKCQHDILDAVCELRGVATHC